MLPLQTYSRSNWGELLSFKCSNYKNKRHIFSIGYKMHFILIREKNDFFLYQKPQRILWKN